MANFGYDSTRVELEFQFSVATSDGQSLTENFKLIINGPINYCTDVKPTFSCQSSSCQVEQVFLYPDNSGRTLTMRKKANQWKYQELVDADGNGLEVVWKEITTQDLEINWTLTGTDGETLCPIEWEPVLKNEQGSYLSYQENSALF